MWGEWWLARHVLMDPLPRERERPATKTEPRTGPSWVWRLFWLNVILFVILCLVVNL